MKNQVIHDERVTSERRRIGSDACGLLLLVLLGSVLVQQYVYEAPFSQYAVEFFCFVGASVYILIRNLLCGNNMFAGRKGFKTMVVLNSLICALSVSALNGMFRYLRYPESFREEPGLFALSLAITFVSSLLITFLILSLFYKLNQKKQRRLEQALEDDARADE